MSVIPSRALSVLLAAGLFLPVAGEAQTGPRLRVAASGQSFLAGDYGNTDTGRAFDVAFLGGQGRTKAGIAFEYGEYTITGEPEAVVDAALDLLFDIPLAGNVYMDLRFGFNVNGWDVGNARITMGGARAGGAVGYRYPLTASLAVDGAVTGSYFFGIYSTVGTEETFTFNTDNIGDVTGTRFGARIGLTLNPGVGR